MAAQEKKTPDYIQKNNAIYDRSHEPDASTIVFPISQYLSSTSMQQLKTEIERHYLRRQRDLRRLNDIWHSDGKYKYPNLDFISKTSQYFYVNDPNLCQIEANKVFGRGKAGTAMLIKIGNLDYIMKIIYNVNVDDYFSLNVHDIDGYDSSYRSSSPCISHNVQNCEFKGKFFHGIVSAIGNNFMNQTIMHMVLNEILDSIPEVRNNFVYQYDAFFCKDKNTINGHNIMDWARGGDLSDYIQKKPITNELVINIMSQIMRPLALLKSKKYGFVHADLKCKNVFVNIDKNGNPIPQLADFDKSSIFWKGIRFHTKPSTAINKIIEVLNTRYHGYPVVNGRYKLFCGSINEQAYTMYSSKPIHVSYDVYTLMCSLVREPKIYRNLQKLPIVDHILDTLFDPSDKKLFMDRVRPRIEDYEGAVTSYEQMIAGMTQKMVEMHLASGNDPITIQYHKVKDLLHNLQSITTITNDLCDISLKVNVPDTYRLLGCDSNIDIDRMIDQYRREHPYKNMSLLLTGGTHGSYHICTTKCEKGTCKTNKYSTFAGYKYNEWDYCSM